MAGVIVCGLLTVSPVGTVDGGARPGAESMPPTSVALSDTSVDPEDHPIGKALLAEHLPLLTPADEQALMTVDSIATVECMNERGFDWTPREPYGPDAFWAFHPLDRESGRRWGYHFHAGSVPTGEDPTAGDPAMAQAYRGSEDQEGCAQIAYEQTAATVWWYVEDVQAVINDTLWIREDFVATDEGAAALSAWSECMAESGYRYDERSDPLIEFTDNGREVSDGEIQVRMTDIDCDIEVGYTVADSAHQRATLEHWIEDNEGRVAQLSEDYDRFQEQLRGLLDDAES